VMKVFKHIMKLSLLFLVILLIGCSSDGDMEDEAAKEQSYYDIIYSLHQVEYEAIYEQLFSEELHESLSLNEFKNNWEEIDKVSGALVRIRSLSSDITYDDLEVIEAIAEYEHLIFDVRMIFDENKKIVDFDLSNLVVNADMPDLVVEEKIIVGEVTDYEL